MTMSCAKAREILELNLKEAGSKMPADVRDALRLSLVALAHFEKAMSSEALERMFARVKESPYTRPPKNRSHNKP